MTLASAPPLVPQAHSPAACWKRLLSRLLYHAGALAVCALALLLGVAVADDYGVGVSSWTQRAIGEATLRHLAGENGLNLLFTGTDRLYGPVFEVFLQLVERALGHDDSRSVFLGRYLLTHLFFVFGCFAGYLLAWRLFGSRWLALFALLLLLLHPRIYAHSFFNSKDAPFLGLFLICLWLAHRAFGKGTGKGSAGAFALCGVAAGLLTNVRATGLVFVALVVFMRLCDVVAAQSGDERRRAGVGCALFALAAIVAFYATMPYLWADPVVRFMEILAVMSAHPSDEPQLFQGEQVLGSELPLSYLPVWFGITAPPLALLLGAVGLGALVWRVATGLFPLSRAPKVLLRNTHSCEGGPSRSPLMVPLRFELLVAACFVVPLLAAFVLRPTLQDDWRHFYFVWGPFVLLAVSGLRKLVGDVRGGSTSWSRQIATAAIVGLAALGVGATAVEMVRLHPHQHQYFNVLAERLGAAVPLRQRFAVADWFSRTRGYDYILEEIADREEHPDAVFNVRMLKPARKRVGWPRRPMRLLRQRDLDRLKFDPNVDVDFYIGLGDRRRGPLSPPLLYERRLYGQIIVQVATPDLSRVGEATADAYWARYRQITSSAPVLTGEWRHRSKASDVDIYRDETAITWVQASCPPGDVNRTMGMTAVPMDGTRAGENVLRADGVRVGGACLWQAPLPDHAIAKLVFPGFGTLVSDAHLEESRRRHAALAASRPLMHSVFDVYREDRTLFYVKTPCVQTDVEAPFFLHVRPVHLGDLPHFRRRLGFDALDFRFGSADSGWRQAAGDIFDGVCMATQDLPDYPVASIATGQYAPGGADLWRVDVGGG